jgi:DNA-binding NarL/FixJ family response regulator
MRKPKNPAPQARQPLTRQQLAVCDLVVDGLSNKQIGRWLGISYRTVEDHRSVAYRKLGVRTGGELCRRVLEIAMPETNLRAVMVAALLSTGREG